MKLKIFNLQKTYNRKVAVQNVSLEIQAGQVIGLFGPNGAGKTTAFYMIAGLIKPDNGKIFLDEKEITDWPMHQRAQHGIAYLPQEPSIFRRMTVKENILCVLELKKFSSTQTQQMLEQLVTDFKLSHILYQPGKYLSGGERRRVEIARSLALLPSFLLLDEPFAGIDPIAISDIQQIIQKLKKQSIGVFITDHNIRETLDICDTGIILSDGKIVEQGSPTYLTQSSKAREHYLGNQFKWH